MAAGGVDYAAIGKRIRARRYDLRLTQAMLAGMIGVSTSFIGHLERGEKKPSLETIVALCDALDTDANALILGRRHTCDAACPLYAELRELLRGYGKGE